MTQANATGSSDPSKTAKAAKAAKATSKKVAIVGAGGYVGIELIRLIYSHGHLKIGGLFGNSSAGKFPHEVYQHLLFAQDLPKIQKLEQLAADDYDIIFSALPHATTQGSVRDWRLKNDKIIIIDLSADFRLSSIQTYESTYKTKHLAPDLQDKAVYGLCEINRQSIKTCDLIAVPGCHCTTALLALVPLVARDLLKRDSISITSLTGISGAGRKPQQHLHFSEAHHDFYAYGTNGHRHQPEIEQTLNEHSPSPISINFTPVIVPAVRGILSLIELENATGATSAALHAALAEFYRDQPFVRVLPLGESPHAAAVQGSNMAVIGVCNAKHNKTRVFCTTDNLMKGAAGQAIQAMNIRLNLDETTGLKNIPQFP